MCGWVKTIGKRYVDGNQFCRGKKKSVSKRKGKRVSGGLGLSHGLHVATYELHT